MDTSRVCLRVSARWFYTRGVWHGPAEGSRHGVSLRGRLHVWTLRAERDGDALRQPDCPAALRAALFNFYQKSDLYSSSFTLVRVRRLHPDAADVLKVTSLYHCFWVSSAHQDCIYLIKYTVKMLKYYYNLQELFSMWICVKL